MSIVVVSFLCELVYLDPLCLKIWNKSRVVPAYRGLAQRRGRGNPPILFSVESLVVVALSEDYCSLLFAYLCLSLLLFVAYQCVPEVERCLLVVSLLTVRYLWLDSCCPLLFCYLCYLCFLLLCWVSVFEDMGWGVLLSLLSIIFYVVSVFFSLFVAILLCLFWH